jgi:hypothetical protein
MDTTMNATITLLAQQITTTTKSEDALRYSQAALNLAHVLQVKRQTEVTQPDASRAAKT